MEECNLQLHHRQCQIDPTRFLAPTFRPLDPYVHDCDNLHPAHYPDCRAGLCTYKHESEFLLRELVLGILPWAPALDNACEERLLRIISNVGSNPIYYSPKMAIWAASDFWGCHSWLEGLQYLGKRGVEKLSAKLAERSVTLVLLIGYTIIQLYCSKSTILAHISEWIESQRVRAHCGAHDVHYYEHF
jgi:hypothetical protein